jgi:hypothetical protein
LGRRFLAYAVIDSVALQVGLTLVDHYRQQVTGGERVSGAFGLLLFLLGTVAALNFLAAIFGWPYFWILPAKPSRLSPDICVAAGVVVGLVVGVAIWT